MCPRWLRWRDRRFQPGLQKSGRLIYEAGHREQGRSLGGSDINEADHYQSISMCNVYLYWFMQHLGRGPAPRDHGDVSSALQPPRTAVFHVPNP